MDGHRPVVLGMIVAFTVVRLTLATVGIPRTRIRLFQPPVPAESPSSPPSPLRPQVIAIRIPRRRNLVARCQRDLMHLKPAGLSGWRASSHVQDGATASTRSARGWPILPSRWRCC